MISLCVCLLPAIYFFLDFFALGNVATLLYNTNCQLGTTASNTETMKKMLLVLMRKKRSTSRNALVSCFSVLFPTYCFVRNRVVGNSIFHIQVFSMVAKDSVCTRRLFIPMDMKNDWLTKTTAHYFTSMKTIAMDIDGPGNDRGYDSWACLPTFSA